MPKGSPRPLFSKNGSFSGTAPPSAARSAGPDATTHGELPRPIFFAAPRTAAAAAPKAQTERAPFLGNLRANACYDYCCAASGPHMEEDRSAARPPTVTLPL